MNNTSAYATVPTTMKRTIQIVHGDITKQKVDAIVNAANTQLFGGTGVCGAIFDAAGYEDMTKACKEIGFCDYGEAVITPGFKLPAKHVIHTVGPVYGQHSGKEPDILYICYYESLRLADKHKLTSIAFPEIATGIYGYPTSEARNVAERAIAEYFEDNASSTITDIRLVRYIDKRRAEKFICREGDVEFLSD